MRDADTKQIIREFLSGGVTAVTWSETLVAALKGMFLMPSNDAMAYRDILALAACRHFLSWEHSSFMERYSMWKAAWHKQALRMASFVRIKAEQQVFDLMIWLYYDGVAEYEMITCYKWKCAELYS